MFNSYDIGLAGEQEAESHLQRQGFRTKRYTKLPGSTDIEAIDGIGRKLLCQVKTAQAPYLPSNPSTDEIKNIKSRASKIGATACVAKVQLAEIYHAIGGATVRFEKL